MITIINNLEASLIVMQDKLIELNDDEMSTTDIMRREILRNQIRGVILNMKMIKAAIKDLESRIPQPY